MFFIKWNAEGFMYKKFQQFWWDFPEALDEKVNLLISYQYDPLMEKVSLLMSASPSLLWLINNNVIKILRLERYRLFKGFFNLNLFV